MNRHRGILESGLAHRDLVHAHVAYSPSRLQGPRERLADIPPAAAGSPGKSVALPSVNSRTPATRWPCQRVNGGVHNAPPGYAEADPSKVSSLKSRTLCKREFECVAPNLKVAIRGRAASLADRPLIGRRHSPREDCWPSSLTWRLWLLSAIKAKATGAGPRPLADPQGFQQTRGQGGGARQFK